MVTLMHQGGWDEFLYFVVPVALGLWMLRRAERRARSRAQADTDETAPTVEAEGRPHYDADS